MSQTEKAGYFQALKSAGVSFDQHYRNYSTEELKVAYDALVKERPEFRIPEQGEERAPGVTLASLSQRDPDEIPGTRLNRKDEDEPIRVDEQGLVWYQEEVRKPAAPKPRGRRVLRYDNPGTKTETVQVGEYTETFEVSGDERGVGGEIKVTLPSYQVGIYSDPRFPFKIHIYNEVRGFDLVDVENFYGGADLVPEDVKRMYVQNDLCYDIRTVVRAIESEHRRLQLQGRA